MLIICRYSTAKHHLLSTFGLKDDVGTHTLASLSAGTVATTICAPADVLKSRIQSASGGAVSSLLRVQDDCILTESRASFKLLRRVFEKKALASS